MWGWVVKRNLRSAISVAVRWSHRKAIWGTGERERRRRILLNAEKVAGAAAVGGAETRDHDLSSRALSQGLRPGTLNPQPHREPDGYGIGRGAQIVDVPTQRGATS